MADLERMRLADLESPAGIALAPRERRDKTADIVAIGSKERLHHRQDNALQTDRTVAAQEPDLVLA